MLQMCPKYCHLLISLQYEMQESSWNLNLDIMSHCSLAVGLTLSGCLHTTMFVFSVPWAPYWSHVIEGWDHRQHPNVLFLFYEEMNKVTQDYIVIRTRKLTL
jgi:hypothetical protein